MDSHGLSRPERHLVESQRRRWERHDFARRLWDGDPTVWDRSARTRELANRLGWIRLPDRMPARIPAIEAAARRALDEGVEQVVVLGMGGSSLAPDVFGTLSGDGAGLTVLDSTHPDAVAAVADGTDPARSLFVVSSKSGTTLETLSFFRFFWDLTSGDGDRFVAVTDPGSNLVRLAEDRGFRHVFTAPPDVGGRFSALTEFGLVPAALAGLDVAAMVDRASQVVGDASAIEMGIEWGSLALSGRDKLTIRTSPGLAAFPGWMEQLIAESLGKSGTGIVPVAGEPVLERYGDDRLFVGYRLAGERLDGETDGIRVVDLPDRIGLAAEMLRAEVATSVAGEILGVHPFDQPDVEAAKRHARRAMEGDRRDGPDDVLGPVEAAEALARAIDAADPGTYVAFQAFLAPSSESEAILGELRTTVAERTGFATTFGWGPRFLHSTGQLHKGGPGSGVFVQIVDRPSSDVPVPETDHTFGEIVAAQAAGDVEALREADRTVIRVDAGDDAPGALRAMRGALG